MKEICNGSETTDVPKNTHSLILDNFSKAGTIVRHRFQELLLKESTQVHEFLETGIYFIGHIC